MARNTIAVALGVLLALAVVSGLGAGRDFVQQRHRVDDCVADMDMATRSPTPGTHAQNIKSCEDIFVR